MGPCVPTFRVGAPPSLPAGRQTIPDVSEWQPCVDRKHAAVFRLAYGTREDRLAPCNGDRLRAWRVWRAGYVYLLPGSCREQGEVAGRIARSVGGVDLIVADGEEPLGVGCLATFRSAAHRVGRVPTATYTGCFSGLERRAPLWIPSYGSPPACGPWLAWQYGDGSHCGEVYVTDCSVDNGITRLHPQPSCGKRCKLDKLLRADIAGREQAKRIASRQEHADWVLIRYWRSRRPQTRALERDERGRERQRQELLTSIHQDAALIAYWTHRL